MQVISLVLVLTTILFVGHWLTNRHSGDNEVLRKLIHMLHGAALAALAFIVPLEVLIIIEAVFLVSMVIVRYLHENFDAIPWIRYMGRVYRVGRLSYGEFFYPISAIALVFLADSKWEFAAAVLILGLADAAAALVGKKYGKRTGYTVLGQKKSLVGSLAFYAVTLVIVIGFVLLAVPAVTASFFSVLWICAVITVAENVGVYGTDNLLIPLVAVYLLNAL